MRQSLAILAVLSGTAFTQSVSFFFPGGYEGVDPVATVSTVNPSTTQFRIACPSGTPPESCGWGGGVDYTIISSTRYQAAVSYDSNSMSLACDYNSQKTQMTCTASMGGGTEYTAPAKTAVLSGSDVFFIQASVVAGATLLSDAGATPTGMKTTVSATNSAAMTGGAAKSGATSTGAAPKNTNAATRYGIEGSALLALAGAAALNVL